MTLWSSAPECPWILWSRPVKRTFTPPWENPPPPPCAPHPHSDLHNSPPRSLPWTLPPVLSSQRVLPVLVSGQQVFFFLIIILAHNLNFTTSSKCIISVLTLQLIKRFHFLCFYSQFVFFGKGKSDSAFFDLWHLCTGKCLLFGSSQSPPMMPCSQGLPWPPLNLQTLVCDWFWSDPNQLTDSKCFCAQADDVTWSPSLYCGLSTPPLESSASGSTHPLSRSTSISGETTMIIISNNNNII